MKRITGKFKNGQTFNCLVSDNEYKASMLTINNSTSNGSGLDFKTMVVEDFTPIVDDTKEIDTREAIKLLASELNISKDKLDAILLSSQK